MRAEAFIGETGYGADAERRDIFAKPEGIETIKTIYCLDKVGPQAQDQLPISVPGEKERSTTIPIWSSI